MLKDKFGLVLGVANKRSIAFSIAQAWHQAGARLAFTYQGDRLKENVEDLAGSFGTSMPLYPCDVTRDEEVQAVFENLRRDFGKLHLVLHSVAFAPKEALERPFFTTSREAFRIAMDVSVYSLVTIANAALPLMVEGGSIITMSYHGAERVVPNYNVMGVAKAALEATVRYLAYDMGRCNVRVNAISAGPINTLAARGISGFGNMLRHHAEVAPLRRNVLPKELGDTGLYLASELSSAVTGEVLYVDCGYNIMAM
ncbi:MAG TPA: enoyl-ACP reductase [Terriglobia bacterium]|nr:enoyl-ACP reductase [Terriglobia bacterium]